MNKFAGTVTWTLVALLLGPTILGLIQNLLLRENTFFVTTIAQNFIYLITATGFVVVTMLGVRASIQYMQAIGATYILMSLFEFVTLGSNSSFLLNVFYNYLLSNVFHLGLGIIIFGAGCMLKNCQCHMIFTNRKNLAEA